MTAAVLLLVLAIAVEGLAAVFWRYRAPIFNACLKASPAFPGRWAEVDRNGDVATRTLRIYGALFGGFLCLSGVALFCGSVLRF